MGVWEVLALIALVVVAAGVAVVLLARARSSRRAVDVTGEDPGSAADRVVERVAERAEAAAPEVAVPEVAVPEAAVPEVAVRPTMRDRLQKARAALGGPLAAALGRGPADDDVWTEVTETLIRADVGLSTSVEIVESAKARTAADDPAAPLEALRAELAGRLAGFDRSLARRGDAGPSVWLFVGVNGTGKTTTIGKLAKRESDRGARVVMAAGDTFRAAASDQLAMWADRAGAHIVKGAEGADPASVVFDAVESAAARGADLVLADTAGRLHTTKNLMAELQKVRRVADKGAGQVTETLLVLDATTGQNGLAQVEQFTGAVDVTGVVLTKLDGSAKGGIVVAVQDRLGVPVKLVGLGEGIEDLTAFDEAEFVDALFA